LGRNDGAGSVNHAAGSEVKTLVVSLDTLRADHLSCLGQGGVLTPNLDALARDGTLFTSAFANDIPTQPAHTAMFTGLYGLSNTIVSHFHPPASLDQSLKWLPSLLQARGMATAAVDHLFLMKDWFIRGYDDYLTPPGRSRAPAAEINGLALPWIRDHVNEEFFLFLHYWDPHVPYVPPSPFRETHTVGSLQPQDQTLEAQLRAVPTYPVFKRNNYDIIGKVPNLQYIADLYRAEVAYLDHEIGNLASHLEELRILDETLLVLVGDHGENMAEHDAWFDHAGLYDSVVRVPLVIRLPGVMPALTIDSFVQHVDLMPTVLDLLDIPRPADFDGQSLVPLLKCEPGGWRDHVVLSECTWQAKRAVRNRRWKYIRNYDAGAYGRSGPELYDLELDPDEQHNVADATETVVEELDAQLEAWVAATLAGRPDPMTGVIQSGLPGISRLRSVMAEDSLTDSQVLNNA
jgi:arylsulfatase